MIIAKGVIVAAATVHLSACVSLIDKNLSNSKKQDVSESVADIVSKIDAMDDHANVLPIPKKTLLLTSRTARNDLIVSWNDVGANLYRLLFWTNNKIVYELKTTSLSLSIPKTIHELGGSVVVEAYDSLGNSVFSEPIIVDGL